MATHSRQAKDRYWDGAASVTKDFPAASDFEGAQMMSGAGSTLGMDTLNSKHQQATGTEFDATSLHRSRPVTPVNGSMFIPPQTPILLPANSLNQQQQQPFLSGANAASNATTLAMGSTMGSAAVLPQYPQQPLPPTPGVPQGVALAGAVPAVPMPMMQASPSVQNVMQQQANNSSDSLQMQQQQVDPRGSFRQPHSASNPQNSPGPVRRPQPLPPQREPPAAAPQPMGLPKTSGKLVPGRMSSGRESSLPSRPGSSQSGAHHRQPPQREISSTAV